MGCGLMGTVIGQGKMNQQDRLIVKTVNSQRMETGLSTALIPGAMAS